MPTTDADRFRGGLARYTALMVDYHEVPAQEASIIMRSVADDLEKDGDTDG